jgi:CRISPR-associated protein Cas5h
MNRIVGFDLRGPVAHYRRPDTLGTHASYPFITRTALRGLIGAVLGLDGSELLPAEARTGLRICGPVRTVAQELSLHGKTWTARSGKVNEFHRPTSIELVVNPHYRAYYAGPRLDDLADRLRRGQSVYHTYLGSAFCLTVPERMEVKASEPLPAGVNRLTCMTVVPSAAVGSNLDLSNGQRVARVGGLLVDHVGGRRFRGTISVLYDPDGGPLSFAPAASTDAFWEFRQVPGEGVVCLW